MGQPLRTLLTNNLTLNDTLLLFMVQTQTLAFYSTKTIGNRNIWHLVVALIYLDMQSIIEYILLNIIEKRCDIAKRIRILID